LCADWIRDCPVVRKENEERARLAAAAGGAAGVGLLGAGPVASGNLDANGMPLGTKQDCWFCLATEHVSTHLILSVGSETYLALAKGCLNDEHVLILPIVHVSSSLDLTAEQRSEVDRYKLALRKYYRSKGLECVMYERFIPTRAAQHMHIQIIPLTREQALLARKTLLEEARKLDASLAFQPIHPMQTLEQANPNRLPFILFELPVLSGDPQQQQHAAAAASAIPASVGSVAFAPFPVERLIHYVAPGGHKVMGLFDFPRAVVATMIGRPERSDWKKVGHTEEQETELVENMKDKFVNFDFTVGEVDASTAPVQ
jgi:diadenosine tetraphosphate (Ap4A) HIT family hydrolase